MVKAIIGLVMNVRLSVSLSKCNNSASTGRIFTKFIICVFFEKRSRKFKFHYNQKTLSETLHVDQNYEGKSISKLQIVVEKRRMGTTMD